MWPLWNASHYNERPKDFLLPSSPPGMFAHYCKEVAVTALCRRLLLGHRAVFKVASAEFKR